MFGSRRLGTIRGIAVHIHWTFWLIPMIYAFSATATGGLGAGLFTVTVVLAIFACVLAHEFGHAFAAEAFGIPTRDITLLPIGGVARLTRIPELPVQELLIALAGPAVNIAIALFLLVLFPITQWLNQVESPWSPILAAMMENLLLANVVLVIFNMLPAFPMDGGRVLRSILAMRMTHLRATEIAARIGRWMALAFVVAAFPFMRFELFLVGVVVFVAGTGELFEARRRGLGNNGNVWFQWSGSVGAHGPAEFSQFERWGQIERPVRADEIVDAIEVREIKPRPMGGDYTTGGGQ